MRSSADEGFAGASFRVRRFFFDTGAGIVLNTTFPRMDSSYSHGRALHSRHPFNSFRGIPHPMRSIGWGWIAGRASARQFLPLNIPLYRLYRASVSDRNSAIAIGPEPISPKKWSNGFCMFLANGSTGRRFDAVDKIGNRIARRNGNQEVDVISLSGKIENANLKSIQNAV